MRSIKNIILIITLASMAYSNTKCMVITDTIKNTEITKVKQLLDNAKNAEIAKVRAKYNTEANAIRASNDDTLIKSRRFSALERQTNTAITKINEKYEYFEGQQIAILTSFLDGLQECQKKYIDPLAKGDDKYRLKIDSTIYRDFSKATKLFSKYSTTANGLKAIKVTIDHACKDAINPAAGNGILTLDILKVTVATTAYPEFATGKPLFQGPRIPVAAP